MFEVDVKKHNRMEKGREGDQLGFGVLIPCWHTDWMYKSVFTATYSS